MPFRYNDRNMRPLFSFYQTSKKDTVIKVLVLVVSLILWSVVSATTAFFWTVFLVWWAFRLDSRILAGVALFFLVSIPIFLSLDMEARAEQFAVYVYFLLVITVTLQIIELRWEKRLERKEPTVASLLLSARVPHPRRFKPLPIYGDIFVRKGVRKRDRDRSSKET